MANVTKSMTVKGMSCNHCVNSIEGSLAQLNGVQSVKVDLKQELVDVSYDDEVVNAQDIYSEIEEIGYDVVT
ncbi:copper chaperone CopZ [Metabacillus endolithicus]|uniref:Copper chaperone CopZ n=1 Tax=Metabacillus endolithicus TaxID=1535204 RepID=A0ABW5C630_9BACI|nr:copper chaperone CopZ [Metabacillus endolithicus]UPG66129.1 copper chaperone CopZ [Metabacillus endolithicus]